MTGFHYHEASIESARRRAVEAGVGDRVSFEVADARSYPVPDGGYDLICFFDALHDVGDPVGAAAHAYKALVEDGTALLVEMRAEDRRRTI